MRRPHPRERQRRRLLRLDSRSLATPAVTGVTLRNGCLHDRAILTVRWNALSGVLAFSRPRLPRRPQIADRGRSLRDELRRPNAHRGLDHPDGERVRPAGAPGSRMRASRHRRPAAGRLGPSLEPRRPECRRLARAGAISPLLWPAPAQPVVVLAQPLVLRRRWQSYEASALGALRAGSSLNRPSVSMAQRTRSTQTPSGLRLASAPLAQAPKRSKRDWAAPLQSAARPA